MGKVAIEFMLLSYNRSLFPWVNTLSVWIAVVRIPLLIPAGANQGSATESLNAYTPGIKVDAGVHIWVPEVGSMVLTQGQYVAAYEVSYPIAVVVTGIILELR